jgi:hypothetical protein
MGIEAHPSAAPKLLGDVSSASPRNRCPCQGIVGFPRFAILQLSYELVQKDWLVYDGLGSRSLDLLI